MKIYGGDCRAVLELMPSNSVDAIVTDPPYELGFMCKAWDSTGIANDVKMWRECLRVLKPGGHLLSFGGSRTYHRMACAIEDAGFEIRDQIMWVYASGMPKSYNLKRSELCACGGNAVQSIHAKQNTEHDLRSLREGDIQASQFVDEEREQILQPCVPVQGQTKSCLWPEGAESEIGGGEQPCLERGQIHRAEERLCDDTQTESFESTTERLCFRAHPGCGEDAGATVERAGGSASPRFESSEQQTPQSENLRDSSGALDGRALPNSGCCARCGKLKKEYEGFSTALKPAHEPICMARKPIEGTVAANVLKWGTGAINVDGCRVGTEDSLSGGSGGLLSHVRDDKDYPDKNGYSPSALGRWPANLIHDGSDEVLDAFPQAPGQQGDLKETGRDRPSSGRFGDMGPPHAHKARRDGEPSADRRYTEEGSTNFAALPGQRRFDAGSAARFFYCAKTSKAERGEGNVHPTVKPLALMQYLCRLVTPPGGIILDPFTGSGSTGVAALREGFDFIGVELDKSYIAIARNRILKEILS